MRWPAVPTLLVAIAILGAAPLVASSTTVLPPTPPTPPAPTRPAGYDQPDDSFAGVWSSSNDPSGSVQILRYPDQMIRIISSGRFEAVGYASGRSAVCLTSVPGPPRSAVDSVRNGVVRLQRRDATTIRALFAQDLASAPALEETWTFRGLKPDRRTPDAPATAAVDTSGSLPAFGDYVYVEELPEAIEKFAPVYPEAARKAHIAGQVMIQCLVGKDGMVHDTRIVKSIPELDEAAVASVRQWVFRPAKSHGAPVAVWVAVPVKFTLDR